MPRPRPSPDHHSRKPVSVPKREETPDTMDSRNASSFMNTPMSPNVPFTPFSMSGRRRPESSGPYNPREREREMKRAIVLRDYHDQPFGERNYGAIRGLFESPSRKIMRHEGIAFMGEFIGTFSFLFMAFMVAQIAVTQHPTAVHDPEYIDKSKLLMIAFGFGFSLMIQVFIWFRVTGGQFNPAVSLGLCVMGAIKPARLATCVIAQMTAGIVAAWAVDRLTVGGIKTAVGLTQTVSSHTTVVQGFFIEMFGTAQLMLTIFFMAGEKHRATPLAPMVIGFSLVLIHLMAANYTGSGVNPARALGTAVISGKSKNMWLYIVAPLVGALIASGIYAFVKWAGYQDVNPGQDAHQAPEADYVLPLEKGREHGQQPAYV